MNLYIEGVLELASDHDPLHLATLEALRDDALIEIGQENEEALNSDRTLIELEKLFQTSHDAVIRFYKNNAWEELVETATALLVARDELATQLEEVVT